MLLAQAGAAGQYGQLIMLGLVFVVFYFFMIRPQQQKQKDAKAFLESVKKGQQVVTLGGIHGRIEELSSDTVTLEIARGVRVVVDRAAISMESSKKVKDTE